MGRTGRPAVGSSKAGLPSLPPGGLQKDERRGLRSTASIPGSSSSRVAASRIMPMALLNVQDQKMVYTRLCDAQRHFAQRKLLVMLDFIWVSNGLSLSCRLCLRVCRKLLVKLAVSGAYLTVTFYVHAYLLPDSDYEDVLKFVKPFLTMEVGNSAFPCFCFQDFWFVGLSLIGMKSVHPTS